MDMVRDSEPFNCVLGDLFIDRRTSQGTAYKKCGKTNYDYVVELP
jgi:hypothetical protein